MATTKQSITELTQRVTQLEILVATLAQHNTKHHTTLRKAAMLAAREAAMKTGACVKVQ